MHLAAVSKRCGEHAWRNQDPGDTHVCILRRLATVKIGVILVELSRTYNDPQYNEMMECLCELIYTALASVVHEHSSDVVGYTVQSVCAMLEEFNVGCVPGEVLDKLLLCVAKGPILLMHLAILDCRASPKKTTGSYAYRQKH